jgi:BirA family biotin operon repressor/biotin-[acetyl-CoA-carboxylase] ligase
MAFSLIRLLQLMSDGDFHSGSAIGAVLGVSRTAVWKSLQKMIEMGLPVESVMGKGYRIAGGIELLSEAIIRHSMSPSISALCPIMDVLAQVDSTNNYAMKKVIQGDAKGYVCLAEYQQSGKGRRGRQWQSPFGHNVYLSLVWQFDGGVAQLEGLSLVVGVVVAKVLSAFDMHNVALKWPNDIVLSKRKLGGILLEVAGDPSGVCQVVIGVGLNVRMSENVDIDQPWASMADQVSDMSRNDLVARLLSGLLVMLEKFEHKGFAAYRKDWERLDAYRDCHVTIQGASVAHNGIAAGVYPNGALKLRVGNEMRAIHGGEVSLRLAHDS